MAERTRTEQALREADRRKDEFLATLGHELRNPLSPLVTSLHLLKFAGPTDPIVGRTATVMHRQLTYLVRLVDDLLEVSRITRGVITVNKEPVELVTILALAIESSRPLIDAGRHELIVDLPHESMMIRGDSVRLTQAFSNVINNAAMYTPAGGHIWITARHDDKSAYVAIRDDGIGVAPNQLSSIFEMFAQVNRTDRRTQGGLGIGLTLARSLIQIHGGAIRAQSDGAGRGSTFEIELPLTTGHVTAHEEPDILRSFEGQRLLVVDDNHDAREMLGALLSALGATVRLAPNGTDALEIVREFHPDAVVLDIGLPGMDGRQVARRIRGLPGGQDVVLIALTGWGQDEDLKQSQLAGFDHHLVKPPDINRLADIIAESRGRRRREPTS
jgi:CheY-like chemotaxis protein